ncbi:multisubunit sodium/proton antiporter, MrpB subunit (TC 2.A.63.1) [Peptoclostridium litorale DSM 5388]|uniref:Na+/H+ antiporter MnhB subunit-related protein domain-containing protein n=1 Tax=Peptoclostridium litorale DSM 5388 TaxID=1121324 RepID=A0A069RC09_PEPLI|nr:MnhB domain-containing protein [Peptoclostridium litorale]KDR94571.1 hypothetical protein CLIT_14c00320 [Peptoclostridium litorale DSM 5388]SIO31555.1 multisubunit sodium/proton antiporter, MrpB subunit (TC 2.A.63.1) [Peptoclostridium litorale DSM 5388]
MKSTILSVVSSAVIPFIQIFGIYVIVNGHISPGGGFAGGTIIGASLILYSMVNGGECARLRYPLKRLLKITCFSLLSYGLLKGYSFINGGLGLHMYDLPIGTPGKIFSGRYLLPLNIFVGAVVAVAMYFLYALFSEGEV